MRRGVAIAEPSRRARGIDTPEGASALLIGRLRVRTPSGAIEFLTADAEERGARQKLALTLSNLFREWFPRQYHFCHAAPFSLEREHEFYRLVSNQLFPLDMSPVLHHRDWMYPVIPVRCHQPHDWINRDYDFDELESSWQLLHALFDVDGYGFWRRLAIQNGLPVSPAPLHPRQVNAQVFTERCVYEDSPLKHLSVAVLMQCYSTNNAWLDCPPGAMMGVEWSRENVRMLATHWAIAQRMFAAVAILEAWLDEKPTERLGRAVELWNQSAQ